MDNWFVTRFCDEQLVCRY